MIRESMLKLPAIFQPLLTHITGKALANSKDNWILNPSLLLIYNSIYFVVLLALLIYIMSNEYILLYLFIPIILINITGLLRLYHVVFGHYCIHNKFFKNKTLNKLFLEIFTIIPIVQNANDYKKDHLNHHTEGIFATEKDADAIFVHNLGFKKGTDKNKLWLLLIKTILSPWFHINMVHNRIKLSLKNRSVFWTTVSFCWIMFVIIFPIYSSINYLFIIWIPYFILYNISTLIQFITEHGWFGYNEIESNKLSWARFLGDYYPYNKSIFNKTLWWIKLIFYHYLIRSGCLVGDLPVHDWHHFSPSKEASKWTNAIVERERYVLNNKNVQHIELWGLYNIINHTFEIIENKGNKC